MEPMRISILSIIFMAVSAIISIGLPVAIFIFFRKKYKAGFLPMIIGAAAFILFVLVLESSIHYFVFKQFSLQEKPLAYIIYGIFMAGIFEETARFISFNILKKKHEGIKTGLSYGIGHGGIEAILLAGFAMISSIVFSIFINTGYIQTITSGLQGEVLNKITSAINELSQTASYMFLVSGLERIFAICIQLSLSVMVFYSVYRKGTIWLFPCAILLHAIIDIPAAAYQAEILGNILLVEGIVCLSAVMSVIIAVNVHKKLKESLTPQHE
ncbi:MAG: YhfC family intramembrane metalloprotease [Treponema sp.]|nr:YhfC family intramembrane metalloprotease [Treponema sp.]